MILKFKKLEETAKTPTRAYSEDIGFDLYAHSENIILDKCGPKVEYGTAIAVEIPEGYFGLIIPRSNIALKTSFVLSNSVSIINSDHREEIKFMFRDVAPTKGIKYAIGEKIGQLILLPYPNVELKEVDKLSDNTEKQDKAVGSSGE